MAKYSRTSPLCIIMRDPTVRKNHVCTGVLPKEMGVVQFNPDLIAGGLSPRRPELAALAAGRLFLRELNRLAKSEEDFAFESTSSGLTYVRLLRRWKAAGRRIEIAYLRISSQLALRRIGG
jgi:predicted ABC-type ATPase